MPKIIDQLESEILTKAKAIIRTEGYQQLNMRKLASQCGIALGTIYNYFPTKESLLEELISGEWEEFFASLDLLKADSLQQRLKSIYQQLESFLSSFHQEWVTKEVIRDADFCQQGIIKKKNFIEKLVKKIEQVLEEAGVDQLGNEPDQLGKFIVANYLAMLQMKDYHYEFFEAVLANLFTKNFSGKFNFGGLCDENQE